ncbi:MAG: hypothetical protein PHS80_07910 [Methanothrix sp.]|nr:hypothetical protein [Methanothrix sp.]MDD4447341.1 hypothetical protein [Methanothrix sp.]
MNEKEGGESQLDVGGKMAIDFRQHTIRQLPRYKAFARAGGHGHDGQQRRPGALTLDLAQEFVMSAGGDFELVFTVRPEGLEARGYDHRIGGEMNSRRSKMISS